MTANFYTSSHSNYWLLDEHELELTKHELGTNDIGEKDFIVLQIFLAEMAHNLGKRMQLKQRVIATSIVYMRRFFSKNSYRACHPLLMVPTALYLANKVEECGNNNLKTIIAHMSKMALEDYQYLYGDQKVETVEPKHIVECEFYLLEEIDCYMVVFHAYRSLEALIPEASRIPPTGNNPGTVDQSLPKDIREMYQTAWYILNDSYKTDVCLLYTPSNIAIAALYLACTIKDREKKPEVRQWFAELNLDMEEIVRIVRRVLRLYDVWESYCEAVVVESLSKFPQPSTQP
eukprot:CFRG5292T1